MVIYQSKFMVIFKKTIDITANLLYLLLSPWGDDDSVKIYYFLSIQLLSFVIAVKNLSLSWGSKMVSMRLAAVDHPRHRLLCNRHLTLASLLIFLTACAVGAQEWVAPLSVYVGTWNDTLYMGCRSGATEGYDAGKDTLAPPPAFGPYAIFAIAAFPNYLQTDIRSAAPGTVWHLRTYNCSGKTVKINWDLRAFAAAAPSSQIRLDGKEILSAQDSLVRSGDLDLEFALVLNSAVPPSSVDAQPAIHTLALFPNPSRECVHIITSGEAREEVVLYDLLGRLVRRLEPGSGDRATRNYLWDRRERDGSMAPSGTYVVRAISAAGVVSRRLVLIH